MSVEVQKTVKLAKVNATLLVYTGRLDSWKAEVATLEDDLLVLSEAGKVRLLEAKAGVAQSLKMVQRLERHRETLETTSNEDLVSLGYLEN